MTAARAPAARRLAGAAGVVVAGSALAIPLRALLELGEPAREAAPLHVVDDVARPALALLVLVATASFARATAGTRAATLAWASVGAEGAFAAFALLPVARDVGAPVAWPEGLGLAAFAFGAAGLAAACSADALAFMALRSALPRRAPTLDAAFWAGIGATALLFALFWLEGVRAWMRGPTIVSGAFVARQAAVLARQVAILVAARRVARAPGAASSEAVRRHATITPAP